MNRSWTENLFSDGRTGVSRGTAHQSILVSACSWASWRSGDEGLKNCSPMSVERLERWNLTRCSGAGASLFHPGHGRQLFAHFHFGFRYWPQLAPDLDCNSKLHLPRIEIPLDSLSEFGGPNLETRWAPLGRQVSSSPLWWFPCPASSLGL